MCDVVKASRKFKSSVADDHALVVTDRSWKLFSFLEEAMAHGWNIFDAEQLLLHQRVVR